MSDALPIFAFAILFLIIFVICAKCCESACVGDNTPAYSAPIVVTSQTHLPPESSTHRTIITSHTTTHSSSFPEKSQSAPYPLNPPSPRFPHNSQLPYPVQIQNMPLPPSMPNPPQIGFNSSRPTTPQPSAPYSSNLSSQDMDVPPNYDEAIINVTKEQKRM